jgi:Putative peptidoglycan binding domain
MISSRAVAVGVAAAMTLAAPLPPAHAAGPVALVIGNGTYTSLPTLPACLLSAHAVAAALRGAGFQIVEREDATSGGTDAARNEAAHALAADPAAPAFIYVCAYASAFNDRPFLLPTSANIARPADVLTQGVLAKSLLDMLTRSGNRPAMLALDVVPTPGSPAALGLAAYAQGNLPDGLGYIAVSQGSPPDAPTPLATALVAGLKATSVQIAPLLAAVQQQLAGSKAATIAALRGPSGQAFLVGAPAPPAPAPPAPAPPAPAAPSPAAPNPATPTPAAVAPNPTTSSPTAPNPAPPATTREKMPAEEAMTEADRRRVQTVLARLGYYDGQVDGVFGPDTRAAIRRFQHEIGVPMSGRLTADQASRLVNGP